MTYSLTIADKAIIVATDGVWDFIEEVEAVEIIKQYAGDAEAACKTLVETATQRWVEDDPTYRDDITALVAFLPFGQGELASRDQVVFTSDSAVALAEKAKGNAPTEGFTKPSDVSVKVGGSTAPEVDSDEAARRRRIKASKEQMRRSVAVKYGT